MKTKKETPVAVKNSNTNNKQSNIRENAKINYVLERIQHNKRLRRALYGE